MTNWKFHINFPKEEIIEAANKCSSEDCLVDVSIPCDMMVPIEWIRDYIKYNTQYMVNPQYEGCEFTEPPVDYMVKIYPYQVETMLKDWEKENETNRCD